MLFLCSLCHVESIERGGQAHCVLSRCSDGTGLGVAVSVRLADQPTTTGIKENGEANLCLK